MDIKEIMKLYAAILSTLLGLGFVLCCEDGRRCITADGKPGTCLNNACAHHTKTEIKNDLVLKIVVKYPEDILKQHSGKDMYIRGNGLGLSWKQGMRLYKLYKDTWGNQLPYMSSITGLQCVNCSDVGYLNGNKLQYRILVDDRSDMIGANFAVQFPVSSASPYFDTKPQFVVYPWFYTKTGLTENFTIESSHIGGNRNLLLYLPPSFKENTLKTYAAFFVFDIDQNYGIMPKDILEGTIYPHAISEEYIIIGFGDYGDNDINRPDLLTPTPGLFFECINGTFKDACGSCLPNTTNATEIIWSLRNVCGRSIMLGGKGDNTLDFLLYEALPEAISLTNYRLDNRSLGIMGYSLGGLMSCYAAWTRPYHFKLASCQSPSFWWPENSTDNTKCEYNFNNITLKNSSLSKNRPVNQKIYIDAGGEENVEPYRLTDGAIEAAYDIAKHEHYQLNKNVWINVAPGMFHDNPAWNMRTWQAFSTILPTMGDPRMPETRKHLNNHDPPINGERANTIVTIQTVALILAHLAMALNATRL